MLASAVALNDRDGLGSVIALEQVAEPGLRAQVALDRDALIQLAHRGEPETNQLFHRTSIVEWRQLGSLLS